MKILVTDDSKEYRDLIITLIRQFEARETIEIDEANSIEKTLDKLNSNNYNAIILDLNLPKSTGLTTVKTVSNYLKEINKDMPIIVLTGVDDYEIGRKAWDLGVKDFLIKDEIHPQDLLRALNFANIDNKNLKKRSVLV
jgi:DNA-binding response OmpR family regulator